MGTAERVREETSRSWQLAHPLAPSRWTLIDGILLESEQPSDAAAFLAMLTAKERGIRERVVRARYFEFMDGGARNVPWEQILDHLDDWIVLYRVDRMGAGLFLKYDCSDAPDGVLLGAGQIGVSVDPDWSIHGVQYFTSGVADRLRVAAFQQRIVPEGCGFVIDSIADQSIGTEYVTSSPELAELLNQSIQQTALLLERAPPESRPFLRCAHGLLCDRRKSRFGDGNGT